MIANLTAKAEKFHIPLKRTMNWINQQTVWIFGLVAGAATIGSFIIAFIVNREKLWDFIRKYWFFIVGFFALFGLWSLYQYGVLAWGLHGLGKLIGVSIPIWAGFMAFAIVMVGWWILRNITIRRIPDEKPAPTQATPPKQMQRLSPESFHVGDYFEDMIDGVWWQWTYSGNIVNVPRPICPNKNCQCDLSFREDWMRGNYGPSYAIHGRPPATLYCPRCGFKMEYDNPEQQVLQSVNQEVLSRIRTDRFRGILYNRAINEQTSARQN